VTTHGPSARTGSHLLFTFSPVFSLVSQCRDRIQTRGLSGRIETEEHAHHSREKKGSKHGRRGEQRRPCCKVSNGSRAADSQGGAREPADHAQGDRLDEELIQDVEIL